MKNSLFILPFLLLHTIGATAFGSNIKFTREYIEEEALKTSYYAKTLNAEADAVRNKVDAQHSLLLPKISLEGSYKYITEIPTLKFPGGASTRFGDNQNYSIGPVLSWTLLDFGSTRKSVNGLRALEKAKTAEQEMSKRQILLNARLAYFKVQLRIEQQRLVSDSLKLVESQHKDIQNRINAGSSNRIDLLSAHKEVLNLKLQSRQIQTDLGADLRDVYTLIGRNDSVDLLVPLEVDAIATSVTALSKYQKDSGDSLDLNQHPLIKMHTANAESLRLTAESFKANQLPKLSFFAKTSIDYPNGPILENFNQNTFGINFSMPLFEGSRSSNEANEKQNMAVASENRREQVRIELIRDWMKAQDQLRGLHAKVEFYKVLVKESEERSKLIYASYKIGRSSFIEVQSANLQALEAKVQSTTNDVQILIQLAFLASISEEQ
jgi:outer membrane protein TolC